MVVHKNPVTLSAIVDVRLLIDAIRSYRIRAESAGTHLKANGRYTEEYTESGPLLRTLETIVKQGVPGECDRWDSYAPARRLKI